MYFNTGICTKEVWKNINQIVNRSYVGEGREIMANFTV